MIEISIDQLKECKKSEEYSLTSSGNSAGNSLLGELSGKWWCRCVDHLLQASFYIWLSNFQTKVHDDDCHVDLELFPVSARDAREMARRALDRYSLRPFVCTIAIGLEVYVTKISAAWRGFAVRKRESSKMRKATKIAAVWTGFTRIKKSSNGSPRVIPGKQCKLGQANGFYFDYTFDYLFSLSLFIRFQNRNSQRSIRWVHEPWRVLVDKVRKLSRQQFI